MPYIIGQTISENVPGLCNEGSSYKKQTLYSISQGKLPPVHYDSHTLNSHSLTHIEAENHVVENGKNLDHYFKDPSYFFGPALVIKLKATAIHPIGNALKMNSHRP
jgi:arylformamidase